MLDISYKVVYTLSMIKQEDKMVTMKRWMVIRKGTEYGVIVHADLKSEAFARMRDTLDLTDEEIGTADDWMIVRAWTLPDAVEFFE